MNGTLKALGVAAVAAAVGILTPASRSTAWADDDACTGEKYQCAMTSGCQAYNSAGRCTKSIEFILYSDVKLEI